MGELKSCPFCGGRNIVIIPCYEENCENECCDGCDDVKYTAVCRKSKNGCGASCGWYKTKEQAIEHWNTHRRKRSEGGMMDELDKCRFCRWYDNFYGCTAFMCNNKNGYEPNKERIVEKAKEKGISVSDLIALINID